MAVYNGVPYLREAIDSILQQTFTDFEFVIVDDGSDDDTPIVLRSYEDHRMVVIRNECRLTLPAALNRGLRAARAPLIARADADDISRPDRLQKQVEFMSAHPEVGVLSSAYQPLDEENEDDVPVMRLPLEDRQIQFQLLFVNRLSHPSIVFRRELVLSVGGYDERFWAAQDYDLWARLRSKTRFANLPDALVTVRVRPGSISRTRGQRGDGLSMAVTQRLLSDYLKRQLGRRETEVIWTLCNAAGTLAHGEIQMGLDLCQECLRQVTSSEPAVTVKEFRQHLSWAFLLQSRYQAYDCRADSLKLLLNALRLDPLRIVGARTALQVLRICLPAGLCRRLGMLGERLPHREGPVWDDLLL
jgi:glycosyltransferase involved in cell wall biosynthesis